LHLVATGAAPKARSGVSREQWKVQGPEPSAAAAAIYVQANPGGIKIEGAGPSGNLADHFHDGASQLNGVVLGACFKVSSGTVCGSFSGL